MYKRLFDVLVSGLGLVVLLLPMLGIALAIKLTSPGPVLHRAVRVGRNGVLFRLLKFRTMVINADKIGPALTVAHDPRITSVGRILRRTKLDELPQLLNVLCGEMSLVGPRPEDPRYVACYTEEQRQVLKVRPGITSPASVRYRNEADLLTGADPERDYIEKIMPAKLKIDLHYAKQASLRKDLSLILRTIQILATRLRHQPPGP